MKISEIRRICHEAAQDRWEDTPKFLDWCLEHADWMCVAREYLPKFIAAVEAADKIYLLTKRDTDEWNAYKEARSALEQE